MSKNFLQSIKILTLAIFLGAGFIFAWTAPSSAPTGGNASGPLSVAPNFQTKTGNGALTIGELSASYIGPWAAPFGRLVLNGGILKIDLSNGKDSSGRDAIFINPSADNKTGNLITNRSGFQFWSVQNGANADILARDYSGRDGYVSTLGGASNLNNDPVCSDINGKLILCAATSPIYVCSNGADDDGDGKIDYPSDPGCTSATDMDEYNYVPPPVYICSDGIDNDGDGKIDYPADPGCTSATDMDESNALPCTINYFTANPATISLGEYSDLSWTTSNCTTASIDHTVGNVSPVSSGSVHLGPYSVTTTYTLTASDGTNIRTSSATVAVTKTVKTIIYGCENYAPYCAFQNVLTVPLTILSMKIEMAGGGGGGGGGGGSGSQFLAGGGGTGGKNGQYKYTTFNYSYFVQNSYLNKTLSLVVGGRGDRGDGGYLITSPVIISSKNGGIGGTSIVSINGNAVLQTTGGAGGLGGHYADYNGVGGIGISDSLGGGSGQGSTNPEVGGGGGPGKAFSDVNGASSGADGSAGGAGGVPTTNDASWFTGGTLAQNYKTWKAGIGGAGGTNANDGPDGFDSVSPGGGGGGGGGAGSWAQNDAGCVPALSPTCGRTGGQGGGGGGGFVQIEYTYQLF